MSTSAEVRRGSPGWLIIGLLGLLFLTACGGTNAKAKRSATEPPSAASPATSATEASAPIGTPAAKAAVTPDWETARFSKEGWKTDFSKHSVRLGEISSGGPPKDGIPALDHPRFLALDGGDSFLKGVEPVIAIEQNGDARAYPLQILIWHEIVNDVVGDVPVTITFCPLCNTALTFDRRVGDRVLDFGTTGNLRDSDLVMYDRQTESWWQQFTGTAIVGELTGTQLEFLPAAIVSWEAFKEQYPRGRVLSKDTGYQRSYGDNPYVGYDNASEPPFLFVGSPDKRLLPKERVVTVALNDEAVAYPFTLLQQRRVVNDTVGGQPITIFWQKGTASALDQEAIARSQDIGSATVFAPAVDGRRLTFRAEGNEFTDEQTGSRWSALGRATAGPLKGRQLQPVVHGNPFWFAAPAAYPNIRVYGQ